MKKFALMLLPLLVTSSYAAPTTDLAGFRQNVQVCIGVNGDTNADGFKAGFVSSDFFDHTRWTNYVVNGTTCVDHTYKHGPKNISVKLEGNSHYGDPRYIKVISDGSCDYLNEVDAGRPKFASTHIRTSTSPSQVWNISLHQAPPANGYRYVYMMSCEYISN